MFFFFTNLLLAYQLELYHARSFLRVVYMTPFVFAREHRQSLVWTMKVRILAIGTGIIVCGTIIGMLLIEKWTLAVLAGILFLPLLPLVIVGIHTILLPLDYLARRRITSRAMHRRAMWTDTVVIGIAGSYGKTSQKHILECVLSKFFRVLAPEGTLNTPLGLARTIETYADTPEIFIAELGEHYPWDIEELVRIVRPTLGIITGITVQHFERFGSLDAIIDTIFELPHGLPKGALCFLSTHHPHIQTGYERYRSLPIGWRDFSWESITDIEYLADFAGIAFTYDGIRMQTRLLGVHMLEPIVRAYDISRLLRDIPRTSLAHAIADIPYVEHRMQPIHNTDRNLWIIDDSFNGNIEGVRAIVRYFEAIRQKNHGSDLLKDDVFCRENWVSQRGIQDTYGERDTEIWTQKIRSSGGQRRRYIYLTPWLVELGQETERIHIEIGHLLAPVFDLVMIIETEAGKQIIRGLTEAGYPRDRILTYSDTLAAHADLGRVLQEGDAIVFQNDWTDNYS